MFRIIVPALCLLAGTASAKDLKVLTGAGMSMPVKALAADFGARTGDHVTVVSDTAGGAISSTCRIDQTPRPTPAIACSETEAMMSARRLIIATAAPRTDYRRRVCSSYCSAPDCD